MTRKEQLIAAVKAETTDQAKIERVFSMTETPYTVREQEVFAANRRYTFDHETGALQEVVEHPGIGNGG